MFEPLILILLSMLMGGAVVQQGGMKSLSLLIAGIFICLIFYGGILGVIIGVLGIIAIIVSWFVSDWGKLISPLYMSRSHREDNKPVEKNWGDEIRKSFQAGLQKKDQMQPAKQIKWNWVEQIRRNLQVGLKERYGELKSEPSNK